MDNKNDNKNLKTVYNIIKGLVLQTVALVQYNSKNI